MANPLGLGIFQQLAGVRDKRAARQAAEVQAQQTLEDRLAQQTTRDQVAKSRTIEDALKQAQTNKLNAPPAPVEDEWDRFETDDGFVEQNKRTREVRPIRSGFMGQMQGKQPTKAPQYDSERGGFVTPDGFQKVPGLPTKPKSDNGAAVTRQLGREKSLADQYQNNPHVKQAYGVSEAAAQIRAAASQVNNPQGDLDIIYSVVKIRDPNSVVREGEIDLQRAARSLGTQVVQAWQKAAAGRMLTPAEREQIVGLVGVKENALRQQIAPVQKRFGEQSRKFGADSSFVAPDPFEGSSGTKPLMDPAEFLAAQRAKKKP